mgnify:CR=1 FL=1
MYRTAFNYMTQKLELAPPCIHNDAKVFVPAIVSASGPKSKLLKLATEEKFGYSARAGALWFEIGGLTFGYTNSTVMVFSGDFYHAPVSTGPGESWESMNKEAKNAAGGVPDRKSYVTFLFPKKMRPKK